MKKESKTKQQRALYLASADGKRRPKPKPTRAETVAETRARRDRYISALCVLEVAAGYVLDWASEAWVLDMIRAVVEDGRTFADDADLRAFAEQLWNRGKACDDVAAE